MACSPTDAALTGPLVSQQLGFTLFSELFFLLKYIRVSLTVALSLPDFPSAALPGSRSDVLESV